MSHPVSPGDLQRYEAATAHLEPFDQVDPSLAPSMNEVLARLRERGPVVRTEWHGGCWAVLTHGAAREAFGDPGTCSPASGMIFPSVVVAGMPQPPLEADPPDQMPLRQRLAERPAGYNCCAIRSTAGELKAREV